MLFPRFGPPGMNRRTKEKPRYFAKPEGTDIFQKFRAASTLTFKVSLVAAAFDVHYIRPKTIPQSLVRIARIIVPINFGVLYMTSVVYISTRLRQANDLGNYIIAGLATAPLIQKTFKLSGINAFKLSCIVAFYAATLKGLRRYDYPEYNIRRVEPCTIAQHFDYD